MTGLGVVTDTDEMCSIIWVKIRRIPWNLQFSEDFRSFRITEIYREEWIDLLECHEVESVSDEPGTLEILILPDILELSENLELWI